MNHTSVAPMAGPAVRGTTQRVQVRSGRGPDQLRFATGRMAEGESNPLSHLGVPPLFSPPHRGFVSVQAVGAHRDRQFFVRTGNRAVSLTVSLSQTRLSGTGQREDVRTLEVDQFGGASKLTGDLEPLSGPGNASIVA